MSVYAAGSHPSVSNWGRFATRNSESAQFGETLLHHRAAAGLTQEQLAARAGLSSNSIAALERGRRHAPRSATVDLLANALGLDEEARAQFFAAARMQAHATVNDHEERDGERGATFRNSLARFAMFATSAPTPLVDRVDDRAIIHRLLSVEGARLITLTGPAGVGKTRLALAAATQLVEFFRDGVVVVDLAPIRNPELVLSSIANVVGILDTGSRLLVDRLREVLSERQQLLVLDNFEQVLPAAAQLADLLAACHGLSLLVTSRAPLQLRWERTLRVDPLPVPDQSLPTPSLDELLTVPSVELFVQWARHHHIEFSLGQKYAPLVARLMAQLDGLPLALELAAARLAVLPLPMLAQRLGDRLRLLASVAPDAPARQRSLDAAVGWSYDLLNADEQRLFCCLGVFIGQVSLDAVASVVSAVAAEKGGGARGKKGDTSGEQADAGRTLQRLITLADQSLILPMRSAALGRWEQVSDDAEGDEVEPTFSMLETVREYAEERLTSAGELMAARRAHAHYFLALAEQAAPLLRRHGQLAWFLRLEREHDNLRAALRWLLDQDEPDERSAALRLATALGWFWAARGYYVEGTRWLELALDRAPPEEAEGEEVAGPAGRNTALITLGSLLIVQGKLVLAQVMLRDALAQAEQRQDRARAAKALAYLGLCMVFAGELEEGTRLLHDAKRNWEDIGDSVGMAQTLIHLGFAAAATGDTATAAARYAAAVEQLEEVGDAQLAGATHCFLGEIAWKRGELTSALEHIQAGLRTSVTFHHRWYLSIAVQMVAEFVWEQTAPAERARLLGAADALAQATGAATSWARLAVADDVVELRERLVRGEEGELSTAYYQGRALPVGAVGSLALRQLDEVTRSINGAEEARQTGQETPAAQRPSQSPLSEREGEVLGLVAQGLSSKEIGRRLSLSPSTINQHVKAIFNKLSVDTRAQAVATAAQRGLLSLQ